MTSSYLEGTKNFFGHYGYNRDGKKGKQQIVVGLLCDELGEPVSPEVFAGIRKILDPLLRKCVRRLNALGATGSPL